MSEIPKEYQFAGERKLSRHGKSIGVNIPSHVVKNEGLEEGQRVSVYSNGHGRVLVILPDVEG